VAAEQLERAPAYLFFGLQPHAHERLIRVSRRQRLREEAPLAAQLEVEQCSAQDTLGVGPPLQVAQPAPQARAPPPLENEESLLYRAQPRVTWARSEVT